MDFQAWEQWGARRWMLLGLAIFGVWFAFGQATKRPVVSNWRGEVALTHLAPKGNQPTLAGTFARQQPQTTGLAADTQHDPGQPWGNPTDTTAAVMTQGYGTGTHAPAMIWGAIDIAIDSDGDGQADPQGSEGAPIYATHRGIIKLAPNSVPAGNHIWVLGDHYKTGYSHLKTFAVQNGQQVERGTLIGYMGSTGQASGPHLDYQIWKDGVNQNPLDYGALTR